MFRLFLAHACSAKCKRNLVAAVAAVALTFAFALTKSAEAMEFAADPLDDASSIGINAVGPIMPGDILRLRLVVQALPKNARVLAFAFDSPGGNLLEAEKIADLIHSLHLITGVRSRGVCASACFIAFAAGEQKFAASDSLIGVHSASSSEGLETLSSMAATTMMARDAAALGVPATIIGKMVATIPDKVEWLTPSDLAAMGVVVVPTETAPMTASGTGPHGTPPQNDALSTTTTPRPATAVPQIQESQAFQQGLTDRRAWEGWFSWLSGDYRDGAFFWSAHRSDPKPPSCYGPEGRNLGEFTAGCNDAQQRLRLSDTRRNTDRDYRRGWNSF